MQNYQNHKKVYPLHMYVFLPITFILFLFSIYKSIAAFSSNEEMWTIWLILGIAIFLLLMFSGMTRLHYGMILQNRLILHEVEFRYYKMTGKDLKVETNLTDSQIFAIRFAEDDEFLPLIEIAQKEKLSADQIKQKIKDWKADHYRI